MLGSSQSPIDQHLMKALAQTAGKIAGDQIPTTTEIYGTATPLNLRLADALLNIGREAIANAVSHANPTKLKITLNYTENSVELEVDDNGQGFSYTPEAAGYGILGMQKRARDVAAILVIISSPELGTRVQVKANLRHDKFAMRILANLKKRL